MNCPLIGVCGSIDREEKQQYILTSYLEAISKAGGIPVLLSMTMESEQIAECAKRLDGLLLAGGNDVAPEFFGHRPVGELGEVNPRRDELEMRMIKEAVSKKLPVLGICRGIQMMNVALGGSLYQDLGTQYKEKAMGHRQTRPGRYGSHKVTVKKGTLLHRVVGEEQLWVNSFHHQAVWELAPGCMENAMAEDGVVEGIEGVQTPFFLGVQWHPERMIEEDPTARSLFTAFITACKG
ncbi:MAG: gamma-glutamyl-gamma-aminobutyrate hydrolase family protein [Eubacteriales bacterium]|nr:gamma-glutamyl-gamma-aminobutyrate hydrolase family protein [Eubacteriales bacterium]